jgi:hypothetical protein
MQARGFVLAVLVLNATSSGCGPQPASAEVEREPKGVIDRSMPVQAALREFQKSVRRVDTLSHATGDRNALVADFMRALERGDSTRLVQLFISKAEFAWLYFPASIYMKQPYELPPEIAWLLTAADSEKGFKRLTDRLGGRQLAYAGVDCQREDRDSRHTYWRDCFVKYSHPAQGRVQRRLFGSIMERDGKHKFLSYANDF